MDQPLLTLIKNRLNDKDFQLPVFDETAFCIQQEVSKDEPDIDTIEKLIAGDPSLTSQLLKIANSVFYKGLSKVATVHTAIMRLGLREIANMAVLASQKKYYQSDDPMVTGIMNKIWQHSVGVAIGSQWLAQKGGYHSIHNEAFVAGLLHDTGELVLLTAYEDVKKSRDLKLVVPENLLYEIMGDFHCEIGEMLLNQWNLPEIYSLVAKEHHAENFDSQNSLLTIVRLVDKACHKLGVGIQNQPDLVLSATQEADFLNLTGMDLAQLEIKLEDSLALSS
jgi:HD-like signal output (HDOD) protein